MELKTRRDLVFLLFDKILLGLLVLGVGLWVESKIATEQHFRQLTLSAGGVATDILVTQRAALKDAIANYLQVLISAKGEGELDAPKKGNLMEESQKAVVAVSQIVVFFPEFEEPSRELVKALGSSTTTITSGPKQSPQSIDEHMGKIAMAFRSTLESIRTLTAKAIQEDYRSVRTAYSEGKS